ncbi:hypothetical protein [Pseudomonas asplenii]|uniref:Uncharacterized protein n=1 Tax=Pseudomonas asplenii TaxID=53407 RepID=A0A1H6NUU9_9PSED|nr:hypothetical protein [Pseudomonas fuscovaginae]SEI17981.1 hypothetical protein SAMN05216581_3500 [Pseudomonas fuscovaginae]
MQSDQTQLLALLEIRGLLADYLGSDVEAPMNVLVAAHLAYAPHNEAEGRSTAAIFRRSMQA